jgi:hypothetical protein
VLAGLVAAMVSWADNRGGVPPLGVYHPRDRCSYCGDRRGPHVVGVRLETGARALRCEDAAACMRRQNRRKQLRLFGDAA